MDTFKFYTDLGFWHVIDLEGLDHLFFITTLALPFAFSKSRKLLWWVTLFTLGHTLSLMCNVYTEIKFSSYWIELLITWKKNFHYRQNLLVFPNFDNNFWHYSRLRLWTLF